MALQGKTVGWFTTGLRKFAAQVSVSVAATICAAALYGHFVSERPAVQPEAAGVASAPRIEGGDIGVHAGTYYPEHLAALDSLSRFRPVSAQRTAELADQAPIRLASLSDAARPRRAGPVLPPPRPVTLAQVEVLPPRRPAEAAPAPAKVVAQAETASRPVKFWGVELPHFVPTGASVMDKLASMKERIGGLIHVSSR
jgi:hypothetical protein